MSTIPGTIKKIASDIQYTSGELIKLLLQKSMKPPLYPNTHINAIGKYTYYLSNECLGWTDNIITSFKVTPKPIKQHNLNKLPVAFSPRERIALDEALASNDYIPTAYRLFTEFVDPQSIMEIIANQKFANTYTCSVLYTDSWKQLTSIGEDIVDQTDPEISMFNTARMSTAKLRVNLFTLERDLRYLADRYPEMYFSYISMILLINSVDQSDMEWVIYLIGNLSFISWDQFTPVTQGRFINVLGDDFIDAFLSNELITVLLQAGVGELILTSSYMYSLLKMLYVVFGYNEFIIKAIITPCDIFIDKTNCPVLDNMPPNVKGNECIYDFIDIFYDMYPTINELIVGSMDVPLECELVSCATIPPFYFGLESIPQYLWRFGTFSYCAYKDYVASKIKFNSVGTNINNKINLMETF
uniref:Uncharacterized protein n=1 Tax=viral metagenome TaxID=1070528 RepID=A0A6C0C950_9ZZZZ